MKFDRTVENVPCNRTTGRYPEVQFGSLTPASPTDPSPTDGDSTEGSCDDDRRVDEGGGDRTGEGDAVLDGAEADSVEVGGDATADEASGTESITPPVVATAVGCPDVEHDARAIASTPAQTASRVVDLSRGQRISPPADR